MPNFEINRQKLLNGLLKILLDPSLRNLMVELLLDIIFFGSDKYNDTVNEVILLHTISFIKNTITWPLIYFYFYFYYIFYFFMSFLPMEILIWNTAYSLLHPSSTADHQFNILVSKHKALVGSKHLSVQYFTKSVLTEVSVGWCIV